MSLLLDALKPDTQPREIAASANENSANTVYQAIDPAAELGLTLHNLSLDDPSPGADGQPSAEQNKHHNHTKAVVAKKDSPRLVWWIITALLVLVSAAMAGQYYYRALSDALGGNSTTLTYLPPPSPALSGESTTAPIMAASSHEPMNRPLQLPVIQTTAPLPQPVTSVPDSNPSTASNVPGRIAEKTTQGIQIKRSPIAAQRIMPQLRTAYERYQSGELEQAEQDYRSLLHQAPNNVDALLGLAAIATRQQHPMQAQDWYRQVLRLDPRNPVAQAGLATLTENIDTPDVETRLKTLLQEQPDAAYLHFGLGAQYAAQLRWPEARSAFFKAFTLDKDRADYAFNLAVSLDHLGKFHPAVHYYRRALELARQQPIHFDQLTVEQRLRTLHHAVDGP